MGIRFDKIVATALGAALVLIVGLPCQLLMISLILVFTSVQILGLILEGSTWALQQLAMHSPAQSGK